jgi:predicted ATP-binding protein involved in virulence
MVILVRFCFITFDLTAKTVSLLTQIGGCASEIVVFTPFEGFVGGVVAEVCFTEIYTDVHDDRLRQRHNSLNIYYILESRFRRTSYCLGTMALNHHGLTCFPARIMTDSPRIYISCTYIDQNDAIELFKALAATERGSHLAMGVFDGTKTSLYNVPDDSLPGESLRIIEERNLLKINEVKSSSNIFLIVLSAQSLNQEKTKTYINEECELALKLQSKSKAGSFVIISTIVGSGQMTHISSPDYPKAISDIKPLEWYGQKQLKSLEKLIAVIQDPSLLVSHTSVVSSTGIKRGQELVISKLEIKNIKCFRELVIDFKQQQIDRWTMLLGDNAIGKSTLLKCIALGLCNASDAAALTRISEMNSEFIRTGETQGSITIELQRGKLSKNSRKKYTITTTITKDAAGTSEEISQQTSSPDENEKFPWVDIFVCGYGSSRSQAADTSHERYKIFEAVQSLFSHEVRLQNPELILLRQEPEVRILLQEKLQSILMLDEKDYQIDAGKTGLNVIGPWGKVNFNKLSDGYRSTTLWVLDFLGWLIYAGRLVDNNEIGGILIIDELEQHLHPRWQRNIVELLRRQFPKTQIIASTHTPLLAAGVADIDESCLLKLERDENNEIKIVKIDQSEIAGKRADQILTSHAFDLLTTRNNKSHDEVDKYTDLLSKSSLTPDESAELTRLQLLVQSRLTISETPIAQKVEKLLEEALKKIAHEYPPVILDIEAKRQLQALFADDEDDI